MDRSRAAAVAGARRVLAEHGVRKTTMGEVAIRGGLAKATLYNHVRTKGELLALVVGDGRDRVLAAAHGSLARADLTTALAAAAAEIAGDEVLVGVRRVEPAALLALAAPGVGAGWDRTRTVVADAMTQAGRTADAGSVELVLRWLLSYVLSPGSAAERAAAARSLAAALPPSPPRTTFLVPVAHE